MNRRIVLASICTLIAFGVGISVVQSIQIAEKYSDVFFADATYYPEKKIVEIRFEDHTQKTNRVVLEVLGMDPSFQRTFDASSFTTTVPFDAVPQYGWKVTPVTFVVEHEDFGTVGIKIDIHNAGESAGNMIFSDL